MTPVIVVEWVLVKVGGQTVCRHIFVIATILRVFEQVSDKGLSWSLMTALLSDEAGVLCSYGESSDLSILEDSLGAWLINRGDR